MAITRSDFRNLDLFSQNAIRNAFQDPATSDAMQRFVRLREEDENLLRKLNNNLTRNLEKNLFVMPGSALWNILQKNNIHPSSAKSMVFTEFRFKEYHEDMMRNRKVTVELHRPVEKEEQLIPSYLRELIMEISSSSLKSNLFLEHNGLSYKMVQDAPGVYSISQVPKLRELLEKLEDADLITKKSATIRQLNALERKVIPESLKNFGKTFDKISIYTTSDLGHALMYNYSMTEKHLVINNTKRLKRFALELSANTRYDIRYGFSLMLPEEAERATELRRMGMVEFEKSTVTSLRYLNTTEAGSGLWKEADRISNFIPIPIPEHAESASWKEYYKFTPLLPSAIHIGSALGAMIYEGSQGQLRYLLGVKGTGKTFAIKQALAMMGIDIEYHTFKNGREEISQIENSHGRGPKLLRREPEMEGVVLPEEAVKINVYDDFHYLCEGVLAKRTPAQEAINYLNKVTANKEVPSIVVSNQPLEYYSKIGGEFLEGVEKLRGKEATYIEIGEVDWSIYKQVAMFYVNKFNSNIEWPALYMLYDTTPNYRALVSVINALDGHLTVNGLEKLKIPLPRKHIILEGIAEEPVDMRVNDILISASNRSAKLAGGLTLKDALRDDAGIRDAVEKKVRDKLSVESRFRLK